MFKKTVAFGLIAAGALVASMAPANAQEVQGTNQIIDSSTVAIDDSAAFSFNEQFSDQEIYGGYGGYGYDPTIQDTNQVILSDTVAVDDSFAFSENYQDSNIENYENHNFWGPYLY